MAIERKVTTYIEYKLTEDDVLRAIRDYLSGILGSVPKGNETFSYFNSSRGTSAVFTVYE